jgi:hypothetical protein
MSGISMKDLDEMWEKDEALWFMKDLLEENTYCRQSLDHCMERYSDLLNTVHMCDEERYELLKDFEEWQRKQMEGEVGYETSSQRAVRTLKEELETVKKRLEGYEPSYMKFYSDLTTDEIINLVDPKTNTLEVNKIVEELTWGDVSKEELLEWREEYKKLIDDPDSELYRDFESRKKFYEREGIQRDVTIQSEDEYFRQMLNELELEEYKHGGCGNPYYLDYKKLKEGRG